MIYLDNAATTNFKPQEVIDAVTECLTKYPYNPNRGNNPHAAELNNKLLEIRKKLALLFNADAQVAFTSGCTQALNLAILGNARRGHVIVSATEHNSVLRPIMQLHKRGFVTVSVAVPESDGQISADTIKRLWKPDTYMVCISHASNVTGKRQNLQEIGKVVRERDGLFLVDCAQSVGYFALDMTKDYVDLAAIGAHKGLHAMQGAGALIFGKRAIPRPINFGGTGTESHLYYQPSTVPDGLESGTLPTPAIVAMGMGIDLWIKNWRKNAQTVTNLQNLLLGGLQQIRGIRVFSDANQSGIAAFDIGNVDSNYVADLLQEKFDITVRGGLQCAPLMHKYLGTTNCGVVRASASYVTTEEECYTFLQSVESVATKLI